MSENLLEQLKIDLIPEGKPVSLIQPSFHLPEDPDLVGLVRREVAQDTSDFGHSG